MKKWVFICILIILIITLCVLLKSENYSPISSEPLIGIKLHGGLANQLFHIASIYCFAKKHRRSFAVVEKALRHNPHSDADYFKSIFRKVNYQPSYNGRFSVIYNEDPSDGLHYVDLPLYDENMLYHGYFQSEKYFGTHRDEILELFQIEPERKRRLERKFPNLDCYFIHVRRGDYLTSETHNIDLSNYYKRAIAHILRRDPSATFMVFSNDIEGCKESMGDIGDIGDNKNRIRYMEDQDVDELDSLYLMSMCRRGGIAANSSFSWWAGYLNTNPKKLVTYPSKWLNNDWDKEIGWKGCVVIDA